MAQETGNVTVRMPVKTQKKLDQIAASFNNSLLVSENARLAFFLMILSFNRVWPNSSPSVRGVGKVSKQLRHAGLVKVVGGDSKHGVIETLIRVGNRPPIQAEEDKGGIECRTLVPIKERLIFRDVKGIGCRHFEHVFVEKRPGKGRRWHGNRRFKGISVTNARQPAIKTKLILVQELRPRPP